MPYLSVSNFWKYQNADVWKKTKTHPPWFKHFVHRDRELDALPLEARLLWSELLGAATRYSNVLEADLNWLYAETRVPPEVIAEMLPLLLKGGWLSQTATPRRSRQTSRNNLEDPRDQEVEVDVDRDTDEDVEQDLKQDQEPKAVPITRPPARAEPNGTALDDMSIAEQIKTSLRQAQEAALQ